MSPEQLLDELVGRWTRGEPLGVAQLLEEAGSKADEVAVLFDAFLERAPRREPTPEALAFVDALERPSLLRARQVRRLKLDEIARALVERLALPKDAQAKVRGYYQDLELGRLDPAGVSASVWVALAGLLGQDAQGLAAAPALPAVSAPAMYRRWTFDSVLEDGPAFLRTAAEAEPDEVDRLFGVV